MFPRPLALGAAGGSFASLALQVLKDTVDQGIGLVPESSGCICPVISDSPFLLDNKSLLLGVILGFLLWPILEILLLWRHFWLTLLRRRFLSLSRTVGPLYREL